MLIYGVTFDSSTNYGSCFQAYALQTSIEKIQINGIPCSYRLIPAKQFPLLRNARAISHSSLVKRLLMAPVWDFHRLQFRSFDKKYMHYAEISRYADLPKLNNSADAFVCGSDVIWNPDQNGERTSYYYLDFARKYKFSYAASFGKSDINAVYLTKITPHLNEFQAISVREESSAITARKCTNIPINIVLDPVLLLSIDDWKALLATKKTMDKYIFVYETHFNQTIRDFVKAIQKITGLKVVFHTTGPKQALKKGVLQIAKPEVWLQQLYNASYIVTNSFHATAFSVIFHKDFYTVVSGDKSSGINVRMNDFLKSIGLSDRLYNECPAEILNNTPDFTYADTKIEAMRKESLAFLQHNLEAAYQEMIKSEKKEN